MCFSVFDWWIVNVPCLSTDISDTQESGSNVDGSQFVAQVFAVRLPTPVVGSPATSLTQLYSLLRQPTESGRGNAQCRMRS